MTNIKSTKRALFASVMALLLCFTMLLGTTFAWFTDSVSNGVNKIVSGNLDVELYHMNFAEAVEASNWSLGFGIPKDATGEKVEANTKLFLNENGDEMLWEPGATCVESFRIKNEGSLALKYQFKIEVANATATPEGKTLADIINISADEIKYEENGVPTGTTKLADRPLGDGYVFEGTLEAGEQYDFWIGLQWVSSDVDNEYNVKGGLKLDLNVTLLATQYTSEFDNFYDGDQYDQGAEYPVIVTVDKWDGTADVSWFLENPNATEYSLTSAEAVVGLRNLIDGTATIPADDQANIPATFDGSFDGVTFKLESDIDLYTEDENGDPVCFDPIGSYRGEKAFKGVFDGQGHTIKNLNQNTWELNNGYYYEDLGLGLFGLVEDATIKNLIIDGANISGESAIVGIVAACAYGDCTFENITVINSKGADYQYYAGGIVGWASGKHSYINCNVDASTTLAAQWGDFDNSTGGLIGGAGGSAEILMKDCNVACRIDAYNDVTSSYQWYAYRRCGMLIGNTGKTATTESGSTIAAAPQLTCENVTVTYGDWANYTYCEFAGTSWPYVRVQAGVSNSAYSNPRYGHPTDANGNKVVDDNHVHNEGEDHFILCVFDQLYGGGQGVYGCPNHDGVTVIYNNK